MEGFRGDGVSSSEDESGEVGVKPAALFDGEGNEGVSIRLAEGLVLCFLEKGGLMGCRASFGSRGGEMGLGSGNSSDDVSNAESVVGTSMEDSDVRSEVVVWWSSASEGEGELGAVGPAIKAKERGDCGFDAVVPFSGAGGEGSVAGQQVITMGIR